MTSPRTERRRSRPVLEPMEARQMLSTSVPGGTWTVAGTPHADTITVDRDPKQPGVLRAFENRRLSASRAASTVDRIHLVGRGGDDTLQIDESHGRIAIGAVLDGGRGKNMLI